MAEKQISRRKFIELAAAGLSLASCTKNQAISRENYDSIANKISSRYIIEQDKSFYKGPKFLVVYAPDFHDENFQESQKERIKTLDEMILFDAIGLEGIEAGVNERTMIETAKAIPDFYKFFRAQRIPEIDEDENFDFTIKEEDSEFKKLQKCGNLLQLDVKKELDKQSYENPSYSRLRDFSYSISSLNPNNAIAYDFNAIVRFEEILGTMKFNPRRGAPGIAYCMIPTSAKKIGLEGTKDRIASGLAMLKVPKEILQRSIKRTEDKYQHLPDKLKLLFQEKYAQFMNLSKDYLSRIEDFTKNTPSLAEDEFILKRRTADWIENMKHFPLSLLIGGTGHKKYVYQNVLENEGSLITLRDNSF